MAQGLRDVLSNNQPREPLYLQYQEILNILAHITLAVMTQPSQAVRPGRAWKLESSASSRLSLLAM